MSVDNNLEIFAIDPWLLNYRDKIEERYYGYLNALRTYGTSDEDLVSSADHHLKLGFVYDPEHKGWWFREWLPEAYSVTLFGDFNQWNRTQLPLFKRENGIWEIFLSDHSMLGAIGHETRYKLLVTGANGIKDRLSAMSRYVTQDPVTKNFVSLLWLPEVPFDWQGDDFKIDKHNNLFIYECHVGMAQEKQDVGTYVEFIDTVLPRIKESGYNVIQLMAVAEHPYYGSFGYHVSNFFAPSSRFGTPEELKLLIKTAHSMGIGVIMDLVHSHFVKNINEGLNELDGTDHHYSLTGSFGNHPYWDSKLFDYSKPEVRDFLLSNLRYWLEEFHFDGFRFDGVTSMIYKHHGYIEFDDPRKYFNASVDLDAITYLSLANKLIHTIKPEAITIAEDVSGMPGMTVDVDQGGIGFDYRLGMAIPDFWIDLLNESSDEQWSLNRMWNVMNDRPAHVKTVAYCESHDQAIVGDKTIAFRLMDKEMYHNMNRHDQNLIIERGMALHKMIRLFTITLGGQAYMNFMGNEFGHPDWIDFPREGNKWSYAYARRQWSLVTNSFLRYIYLHDFDHDMIEFVEQSGILKMGYASRHLCDETNKTIAFSHGDYLFIFNWHTKNSIPDYCINVDLAGEYAPILSTDQLIYGGLGRVEMDISSTTTPVENNKHCLKIYNVCRTAMVMKRVI